jgi:hypothetical protein
MPIGPPRGISYERTYLNVPNGSYLDGEWILVKSTANGTTASGIIAEF